MVDSKFEQSENVPLHGEFEQLFLAYSEGSNTRRNLIRFWVKSLEIFAEIRKSYSKSQSEILKLANFLYFNSVNFHFLVHGGGVSLWTWSNRHGHAQILSTSAQAVKHGSCRLRSRNDLYESRNSSWIFIMCFVKLVWCFTCTDVVA